MVQSEGHIAEAVDAVWFIIDILPVGAEAWGARRIVPVQVRIQLPNDFLVHDGFKLSGKEGGPSCLLEAMEVLRLEVIRRAAAPVHDMLVLALAAQLAVPVGDAQVVIHHGVAVGAVLQDRVEKGLQGRKWLLRTP